MESEVLHHEAAAHVESRVFRFVDQTDRSQRAFSEHKALVRSHVMTEVRRQRRSKLRLKSETRTEVPGSHNGTGDPSPDRSHWALPQEPIHMLDPAGKADSDLAEDFFQGRVHGDGRQQSLTTSHPTSGFQYTSDLQSLQASDPWLSGLQSDRLETRTSGTKSSWARSCPTTEKRGFHASSEYPTPVKDHRYENTTEIIPGQLCSISMSPTILGASRVDPFRVLPIPSSREVYELLDNYTVTIPLLMYGTHTKKPVHLRLCDLATGDSAALHSMLAYSARQIDFMRGCETSQRSFRHCSATLRLVHERLNGASFRCEDGLVLAVALLAFAERRFGDDAIAQQHWLALREVLRSRGGIERLNLNRWLAAVLYWNSLVWSSNSNVGETAQIEWPSLLVDPLTYLHPISEFIDFLIDLARGNGRWLDHLRTACSAQCQQSCTRRRVVFSPEGPLYQVVSPEGLHEVVSEGNVAAATIQRTASTCQTPCLLYLNIVMVEYETKPELLEQFLGRLIICIYEDSLDKGISAEQLLIRLLGGLEDTTVMLTCRAHKTLRMAAVIQQLGVKAQQRIHCALLEALVYPVSAELAASDGLLFALAEGLAELPGPVCVNDLDRFIAASPLQL